MEQEEVQLTTAPLLRDDDIEEEKKQIHRAMYEQKMSIQAYESELKSTKQLLSIQLAETKHCTSYITILNVEVDTLKQLVHEKQEEIHRLNLRIMKSDDRIVELENELDLHKINRLALFDLEQQNQQLLERIKEMQSKVQELEVENTFLSQHKQDKILVEEKKLLKLQELEIKFPYEKTQLLAQLKRCDEVIQHQRALVEQLTAQNTAFYQMMQWTEEMKNEQLSRAKLAEYQALIELDVKERENNQLEQEKKILQQDHQIMLQKSREADKQLMTSFQSIDELNDLYSRVIHTLENENYLASYKEKLLVKENYLLQAAKQLLTEVIEKTTDPLSALASQIRKSQKRLYTPSATKTSLESPSSFSKTSSSKQKTSREKPNLPEESNRQTKGMTQLSKTMNSIPTDQRGRKGSLRKSSEVESAISHRPKTTADLLPSRNNDPHLSLAENSIESKLVASASSPKYGLSLSPSIVSTEDQLLPSSPSIQFDNHQEYIAFSNIKHSIINKYLSLFIEYCQFHQWTVRSGFLDDTLSVGGSLAGSGAGEVAVYQGKLLLNHCGLNSDDMNLLIDWLRKTSSKSINVIDLRDNHIDVDGFEKLLSWIISWSNEETDRTSSISPLQIDLRGNQITIQDLAAVNELVKTNGCFVHVNYKDDEDRSLLIYSKSFPSDKTLRVEDEDSEENAKYSIAVIVNLNGQYRRTMTRKRLELQESFTNRFVGSIYTTEEMKYHQSQSIYPRDHIMRDRYVNM